MLDYSGVKRLYFGTEELLRLLSSDAGMTVSATMLFAERAVIPVVATDGFGCAHRVADGTLDIFAGLIYRGRSPVVAVCA